MPPTSPSPPVDVPARYPDLRGFELVAVHPHPRRGDVQGPDPSRFGGELWPADEPWLRCDHPHLAWDAMGGEQILAPSHCPYVAVRQLQRRDAPDVAFPGDADLLQVLWCPNNHEMLFAPVARVVWRTTAAVGAPLAAGPAPTTRDPGLVPGSCVVHPEAVREYPQVADLPPELAAWRRWTPLEEAGTWEGPTDRRLAIQTATGVDGRGGGSLYVFVWRRCDGWPTTEVYQR